MALPLCNSGRLLSVRPAPTLFDHLYASLHRAFGHTRPASVPGLSVGLPPSPRLGLRPKPHFQKLYRFIDSLKSVSPDTDFLLPIIAGYRPLPTIP